MKRDGVISAAYFLNAIFTSAWCSRLRKKKKKKIGELESIIVGIYPRLEIPARAHFSIRD